ncbi:arginyl-tRNA synthetase [Parabacteroides sp. PF5-5]|nr:arginyl-tRNA synthetase [Parabacteroides sp. PH5-39]MDH6314729.1 arginyl-tRNA synthetase [Parabacteroides sp. PF5-13]MDH6318066.1 arginyl-tRNA synthetase [Parabacteroides sp. PH5-13]MDH6322003.1 arginyl-tRNA synthetase [Parabacteroides sp. PH5-8]MDH6326126.1 arginyl-tRNA synthetase [Parabacteroides sp. PH5-41]MDH6333926.1 arginyl-tRNA synthetase [Parabacteroides sp. PF5-5]MDH6344991.1 arginyl-tRNA synthetase [Parabacteroides sp. PH5-46]MDH6359739.1 arginyl-tRNA synthetase [Parabacteroides
MIEQQITGAIITGIKSLYGAEVPAEQIQLQKTKKEFKGHLTLVVFPLLRVSKKSPEVTAQEIGEYLQANEPTIASYNVIKGFLNLTVSSYCWIDLLNSIHKQPNYGITAASEQSPLVMIEYSSPNTNKPLHLGHIRNNLLGYSLSEIMKANGNKVVKTNIVNDRGIHICKSMLAWEKWGNGETPESSGKKGDHLIGEYYVLFDKHYKQELKELEGKGLSKEQAEAEATLMAEAREMLRKWEAGDEHVRSLWSTMNSWVYAGFDETYKRMGVDFDKIYYESETYLEGKNEVLRGMKEGVFYQREDASVWADLTKDGLDEKLLLRADGTSVYMTQDIGTAKLRFDDYPIDKMIYVVGNEQNYHFQVLSILLDKLGFAFGKGLVHFSYGMVELPEGKMKSREGTVVDADDLMDEMVNTAREISQELGKLDEMTPEEIENIARIVGLGSLKYFILKVDPRKNMTFNPKESIDFNGNTGSFIQYTYARIRSVLRKAAEQNITLPGEIPTSIAISEKEENLIQTVAAYASTIQEAGTTYSPALICNYIYDLVKEYNQFYHDFSILREENADLKNFRLILSENVAQVIKTGISLLGIEVPERM